MASDEADDEMRVEDNNLHEEAQSIASDVLEQLKDAHDVISRAELLPNVNEPRIALAAADQFQSKSKAILPWTRVSTTRKKKKADKIKKKSKAIDEVFGDAEAILDSTAHLDASICRPALFLFDQHREAAWFKSFVHLLGYPLIFLIHSAMKLIWDAFLLLMSIFIALPGAFVMLLLRTQTVETVSTAMQAREVVLDQESAAKRTFRWVSFLSRAIPMAFFLCGWPAVMCLLIFPNATKQIVVGLLALHLSVLLLLQIAGVLRTAVAWRQARKNIESAARRIERPQFSFLNPMHVVLAVTLAVEMVQLTTLPIQSHAVTSSASSSTESSNSTSTTHAYKIKSSSNMPSWLATVSNAVLLSFYQLSTTDLSWTIEAIVPVSIVCLLLLIIGSRIVRDVKTTGGLKYQDLFNCRVPAKDLAAKYLFYSLTGSILYGHGRPRSLSNTLKMGVVILSDALFLSVTERLLSILRCEYTDDHHSYLLLSGHSNAVTCWHGDHALWACLSLAALSFYIPTSIMLAPILVQGKEPSKIRPDEKPEISFIKLFSMATTVLKCFSLIVALLTYSSQVSSVIVYLFVNLVMFFTTVWWVQTYGTGETIAEPCTDPFFARFKAMAFLSASWACIWVLALEAGSSSFRSNCISVVLPVGWACSVALAFIWQYRTVKQVPLASKESMANEAEHTFIQIDGLRPPKLLAIQTSNTCGHQLIAKVVDVCSPFPFTSSPFPCTINSSVSSLVIPNELKLTIEALFRASVENSPHKQSGPYSCRLNTKMSYSETVTVEGIGALARVRAQTVDFGVQTDNAKLEQYPFSGVLVTASVAPRTMPDVAYSIVLCIDLDLLSSGILGICEALHSGLPPYIKNIGVLVFSKYSSPIMLSPVVKCDAVDTGSVTDQLLRLRSAKRNFKAPRPLPYEKVLKIALKILANKKTASCIGRSNIAQERDCVLIVQASDKTVVDDGSFLAWDSAVSTYQSKDISTCTRVYRLCVDQDESGLASITRDDNSDKQFRAYSFHTGPSVLQELLHEKFAVMLEPFLFDSFKVRVVPENDNAEIMCSFSVPPEDQSPLLRRFHRGYCFDCGVLNGRLEVTGVQSKQTEQTFGWFMATRQTGSDSVSLKIKCSAVDSFDGRYLEKESRSAQMYSSLSARNDTDHESWVALDAHLNDCAWGCTALVATALAVTRDFRRDPSTSTLVLVEEEEHKYTEPSHTLAVDMMAMLDERGDPVPLPAAHSRHSVHNKASRTPQQIIRQDILAAICEGCEEVLGRRAEAAVGAFSEEAPRDLVAHARNCAHALKDME